MEKDTEKLRDRRARHRRILARIRQKGAEFRNQRSAVMDGVDTIFLDPRVTMNAENNKLFRETIAKGLGGETFSLCRAAGEMFLMILDNPPFSDELSDHTDFSWLKGEAKKLASCKSHLGTDYQAKNAADWQVMSGQIADCLEFFFRELFPVKRRTSRR